MYGPNSLPADQASRLTAAIRQVVESEQFRKRAEEQGAKALFLDGTGLAKLAADERAMWTRIVRVAKIKAD